MVIEFEDHLILYRSRQAMTSLMWRLETKFNAIIKIMLFAGPPVLTLPSNSTSLKVPVTQNTKMLDCPYLANPPPVVQWLESNQALGENPSKHRIFDNGSLLISDLAIEDSGNYMCIIVNSVGVDEATHDLLVISKCTCSSVISY